MTPMRFDERGLYLLDQTLLPHRESWIRIDTTEQMEEAIASLRVRGAPAIGIAAALALALEAARPGPLAERRERVYRAASRLRASRPTAVNLGWACDRMVAAARARPAQGSAPGTGRGAVVRDGVEAAAWADGLRAEALRIWQEDRDASAAMARHGAALFPSATRFLTHCNTGGLATGGGGTALGVILELQRRADRSLRVWATETRPLLQGARLTAWELRRAGVQTRLVTDGAAPFLLLRRAIQGVLVGADRVARNGDVANKIGTYSLALAAREAGIPFVVVAPESTLDASTPTGAEIIVEERDPLEVTAFAGVPSAPEGVLAENPAFDVTPAGLVTALVTERGAFQPPATAFAGVDTRS